jgi:segregation and condensation protein B
MSGALPPEGPPGEGPVGLPDEPYDLDADLAPAGRPRLLRPDGPVGEPDNLVLLRPPSGDAPPQLDPPADAELPAALEALLLAADGPVSLTQLDGWLGGPGEGRIRRCLQAWAEELDRGHRGFRLEQVARGWQLRTDKRFARWVSRMRGGRPARLSKASLDVLAILAYRQPMTRAELDDLRGVDSGGVLKLLCERGLATIVGRKEIAGRPLLYGTTRAFLALFGLRDLSELPTLRDLRELRQGDPRLPAAAAELLGLEGDGAPPDGDPLDGGYLDGEPPEGGDPDGGDHPGGDGPPAPLRLFDIVTDDDGP